jgi:two-component system chemotaxis response regulator CheV
MISVINLRACLGYENDPDIVGLFFITNFNNLNTAFHVDEVLGIHRVSWEDINEPDSTISSDDKGVSTGVIKLDNRLIVILDFEKIVSNINPETGLKVSDLDGYEERDRSRSPVMIAEDSPLLSKLIVECLKKAGYTNLNINPNGQDAWDKLCEMDKKGTVLDDVHCIVTDIEMPKMDGHRLTKLVKGDDTMKHIPVILFSSLINDELRRKGESLGADAQLTKPEIGQLVEAIDMLVDKYEAARREAKG